MPALRESSNVSTSYRGKLIELDLAIGWSIIPVWALRVPHPGKPLIPGQTRILGHPTWRDFVAKTRRTQQYLRAKWLWECNRWQMPACLDDDNWDPDAQHLQISYCYQVCCPRIIPLPLPWMETNYSYLNFRRKLQREHQELVRTKYA